MFRTEEVSVGARKALEGGICIHRMTTVHLLQSFPECTADITRDRQMS